MQFRSDVPWSVLTVVPKFGRQMHEKEQTLLVELPDLYPFASIELEKSAHESPLRSSLIFILWGQLIHT